MALIKCDQTNKDKQKVIEAQKLAIKQCQDRVTELESKESATINSKGIFFILGAVFTAIIGLLVRQ